MCRPGHNWRLAGSRLRIEITVDSNAGTVQDMDAAKNVVYTREVVTKCRHELYSQKNPIPKDISGSIGCVGPGVKTKECHLLMHING